MKFNNPRYNLTNIQTNLYEGLGAVEKAINTSINLPTYKGVESVMVVELKSDK